MKPWRLAEGRKGMLLTLPEAERQRVVADGIFTSAPWADLHPFPDGGAAAPGREGGNFVRERGWVSPFWGRKG